jgi:hypothetical protein
VASFLLRLATETSESAHLALRGSTDSVAEAHRHQGKRGVAMMGESRESVVKAATEFLRWFDGAYPKGQSQHRPGLSLYHHAEAIRAALTSEQKPGKP